MSSPARARSRPYATTTACASSTATSGPRRRLASARSSARRRSRFRARAIARDTAPARTSPSAQERLDLSSLGYEGRDHDVLQPVDVLAQLRRSGLVEGLARQRGVARRVARSRQSAPDVVTAGPD